MKFVRGIAASLTIILFARTVGFSQSMYDTYDGFTVPTTPVVLASEQHPSLWFTQAQVGSVKARKDANAYALQLWNKITTSVNSYKLRMASGQDENDRPRMAKYCAFGWIMKSDTVARQKAIEALLLAYDNVPRTASSENFGGNYDEIYRATWLQNYCVAYDWVWSQLTPQQDSLIRSKLLWETALLRNHMVDSVRYAPRPHNHRSKPAYALGTAALTFSSDSRAQSWLQFALTQQNTVTKYMFSADGLYREGSHYNVYSLENALPFLWLYKNVAGVDLFQTYKPMFEYPLKVRNGQGWLPNIEDGYIKPYPTHMAASAYSSSPTSLHPSEPLSKLLQWNWFTTSFVTSDYTGATNDVVWDVDEFLCYDPAIPQVVPEFSPTIKMENGQVVFRSNSNFSQPVDRYFLFHGVAESDNHQHPDLLSYIVDYQGTILATDAGYGANGFSDANRAWYISPSAHNTVTVNGFVPLDLSTNVRPPDLHFLSSPVADFSEKEATTAATNGKLRRGILFPRKEFWVVYDAATGSTVANYSLQIHGRGAMSRTGNRVTWTTSADSYGAAARLHAAVFGSEALAFADSTGYTSLFKDQVTQSWIRANQSADSVLFLHLLFPGPASIAFPAVSDLSAPGVVAFEVLHSGLNSTFAVQKKTTSITIGNMTTDARFSWSDRNGSSLVRCALNEGTLFQWNGGHVIESSIPLTLTADFSDPNDHELYVETPNQSAMLKLRPLWGSTPVSSVEFNGSSISFTTMPDGRIAFDLATGGKIRVIPAPASANVPVAGSPFSFRLDQNYPNPFNSSTRLRFRIAEPGKTNLKVFNVLGQCIRVIFDQDMAAGIFERSWDATDDDGMPVASGLYVFELSKSGQRQSKKGILIK